MFQNVFSDDNNKSWAFLATPYKPVKIDLAYAYKHFFKNTNDKNRNFYKEAFLIPLMTRFLSLKIAQMAEIACIFISLFIK